MRWNTGRGKDRGKMKNPILRSSTIHPSLSLASLFTILFIILSSTREGEGEGVVRGNFLSAFYRATRTRINIATRMKYGLLRGRVGG